MKTRSLLRSSSFILVSGLLAALPALAADNPVILPVDEPEASETHRVIWSTEPGIRYELQQSTDLAEWTTVAGFPTEAAALAQQHKFAAAGDRLFFRVVELDEQAPVIVDRYPTEGSFGVGRFSTITVELADGTGVDPESILLTVGDRGSFTVSDAELSFEENVLVFDTGGDTAIGGYGESVTTLLYVADLLGNDITYEWTFELEVQAIVADNIFVFGSPPARAAGQRLGPIPTRILSDRMANGPIRMNTGATEWTLHAVEEDVVVISYTGDSPPPFEEGTLICNLTPASIHEVFYRRILSISDDPAQKLLTLTGPEVSLEEFVQEGSLSATSGDLFFPIGEDGVIERAFSATVTLDPLGFSLDGRTFSLEEGGVEILSVTMEELHWWLTPSFRTEMDLGLTGLRRFHGSMRGDMRAAMVLDMETRLGQAFEKSIFKLPNNLRPGFWVPLGAIGPIPVTAEFSVGVELKMAAEAAVVANVRTGFRQTASAKFGLDYDRSRSPAVEWIRDFGFHSTLVPLSADLAGELSVKATLEPDISLLVYGLAGLKTYVAPGMAAVASAGEPEGLTGYLEADVTLGLTTAGMALDWLSPKPTLSRSLWEGQWQIYPRPGALAFTLHPQDTTVTQGDPLTLSARVSNPGAAITWSKEGTAGPVGLGPDFRVSRVEPATGGIYRAVAVSGGTTVVSNPAVVTVEAPDEGDSRIIGLEGSLAFGFVQVGQSATRTLTLSNAGNRALTIHRINFPAGFSGNWSGIIPAGGSRDIAVTFRPTAIQGYGGQATVQSNATSGTAQVTVSGMGGIGTSPDAMILVLGGTLATSNALDGTVVNTFYIGRCVVTWGEWKAVRAGSVARGYDIGSVGTGCTDNHPVLEISWFDALKWCNLKSEMEGLTPVYTVGGSIYRTGQPTHTSISQNLSANGYRLPLEAEWEFAARGGRHTNGYNYSGSNNLNEVGWYWDNSIGAACNLTSGRGTWPVGQKNPNELGIHDMSGNVWEWCWDASDSFRAIRGGNWFYEANRSSVSHRAFANPAGRALWGHCLRFVRSSGQ